MNKKTSIRYKTIHERNGEISGLKMKGFGMERNGGQENFQPRSQVSLLPTLRRAGRRELWERGWEIFKEKMRAKGILSSSAGFLSSISTLV